MPKLHRIEVPLTFDVEFFNMLQGDVILLDALQAEQQKFIGDEIVSLSTEVASLAKYDFLDIIQISSIVPVIATDIF